MLFQSMLAQAKMLFNRFGVSEEEGQGLVEYALIIFFIALIVLGVLAALGGQLQTIFQQITDALAGGTTTTTP